MRRKNGEEGRRRKEEGREEKEGSVLCYAHVSLSLYAYLEEQEGKEEKSNVSLFMPSVRTSLSSVGEEGRDRQGGKPPFSHLLSPIICPSVSLILLILKGRREGKWKEKERQDTGW